MLLSEGPVWRRKRLAVLGVLLLVAPMLSGCVVVDFFTPQHTPGEVPSDVGRVRIWVATAPGALGDEFAHLNVTFQAFAIYGDIYLNAPTSVPSIGRTVDLVTLERTQQAALVAEGDVHPGEYFGYGYRISKVILGERRIVGNDGGEAVYRVEERDMGYVPRNIELRLGGPVMGGYTTDIYLEADLVDSLFEQEGRLAFTLVPEGSSMYVGGAKVATERYAGGSSAGRPDDPNAYGSRWNDAANFDQPLSVIDIEEAQTGDPVYSGTRVPSKRVMRAVGLGEDLEFSGGRSRSLVGELGPSGPRPMPIVAYLWDFGDGTGLTSTVPTTVKNYTRGGLYDVVLTVTDGKGLSNTDHVTLFVPYGSEQALAARTDGRAGTLYVGSATAPTETTVDTANHTLSFLADLDGGDLRLGGYRVTVTLRDPLGGLADLASARVKVASGHFVAEAIGYGSVQLESAGVPSWRGPLSKWVDTDVRVDVELVTGVLVDYDIQVEALYFHNLSRGLDQHAAHLHGEWLFGPKFDHLYPDGTIRVEEEEE